jgi:hypothetical protein
MAQALATPPARELLQWGSQGVAREAEAPEPDDYFTTMIGDTPIIVVRTAYGQINAARSSASRTLSRCLLTTSCGTCRT